MNSKLNRRLGDQHIKFRLANALIIVGTDRNAGKTSLACRIIENNAPTTPIIAIKISPHFHPINPDEDVILKTDHFIIIRENNTASGKDSSRFLRAGASEVYYIQVWDDNLSEAFTALLAVCGKGKAMVIESGWLRNLVEPGLFLIVNKKGNSHFKERIDHYKQLPHLWVESDGVNFSIIPERIMWLENHWELR